jgi:hypothetical protein
MISDISVRLGIGIELAHGPDVCFGSLADMCDAKPNVRFTPESGHVRCTSQCPVCAKADIVNRIKFDFPAPA